MSHDNFFHKKIKKYVFIVATAVAISAFLRYFYHEPPTLVALAPSSVAAPPPPAANVDPYSGIRSLPYPYSAATSVADDIDGTRWSADLAVKRELFDRFGFNMGRSMHMYAPPRDREGRVSLTNDEGSHASKAIINAPGFENPTYYLMRSYHRGEIDYVHMWSDYGVTDASLDYDGLYRETPIIASPSLVAVTNGSGKGKSKTVPAVRNEPIHFPGMRFYLTADAGVRGVALEIENVRGHHFRACFGKLLNTANCVWKGELDKLGERRLKAFFFKSDALPDAYERLMPLEFKWRSMRLIIEAAPGVEGRAEVSEVLYSAFNRNLVSRQSNLLDQLGISFWSYSDHGGADNGVNMFRNPSKDGVTAFYQGNHWAFKDPLAGLTVNNWPEGAKPGSEYYFADLIEKTGSVFFLFGNANSQNDFEKADSAGYSVNQLLTPYRSPTGKSVYDVLRYFPGGWRNGDPGDSYGMTWSARFGQAISDVLRRVDNRPEGSEGVIFGPLIVHLGFEATADRLGIPKHEIKLGDAFNDETDAALRQLSNRFYNFDGAVPERQRIWVASINRLYRYAQVMRHLPDNISNRPDNTIDIRPWRDEVTGETLPASGMPGKDLAGITLYVADSATVSVTVNGVPFKDFTRNPSDHTGRESITFADLKKRRALADDVWQIKKDRLMSGQVSVVKGADTPSGRSFLRLSPGGDATLELDAHGPGRDGRAQTHFSFFARASELGGESASLKVGYRLADGRTFTACVSTALPKNSSGWQSEAPLSAQWTKYVFDLTQLHFAPGAKAAPPRGDIKSFFIGTSGKGKVDIDAIAFSRDHPAPSKEPGILVSGRLLNYENGVTVRIYFEDGTMRETRTQDEGYFLFHDVPAGSVIRLEAEGAKGPKAWYDGGQPFEVWSHEVELDIAYGADAPGLYDNEYKGLIAWTKGLVPRNREDGKRRIELVKSEFGPFRTYEPNHLAAWWGRGQPQEYDTFQYANNLGFLDIDRNPDAASQNGYNVLLFGDCLVSGDQFETSRKLSVILEKKLSARTGLKVQTPLLGHTQLTPYHFSLLYDRVGRKFAPKVAYVTVMMSTFRNASPTLRAEENGLEVGAWPDEMLDVSPDGQFFIRPPDSRYFMKKKTWARDWQGGNSHNFSTYTHPTEWMQEELARSTAIITESLRRLRDQLAQNGGKLVLVLAQDRYTLNYPPTGKYGANDYDVRVVDERYSAISKKLGIRYINLVNKVQSIEGYKTLQWVFDPHWTEAGHRMTADILVGDLFANEGYSQSNKVKK